MLIGYARTSTVEQIAGLEAQLRDLAAVPCEKVFKEQVSSVDKDKRTQLDAALDHLRPGDVLVVTKLDRLARSVAHLHQLLAQIEGKGAHLRVLAMGLDTSTPTGRLMLNLLGSVAEFERAIMLERQREGIAKAKAEGKYRGRKPVADAVAEEVKAMAAAGVPKAVIAREMKLSRQTVYALLDR